MEQDLGQTVTLVKAKRAAQAGQGEAQLYAGDPYGIHTVAPGQHLPAPPVSAPLLLVMPSCAPHVLIYMLVQLLTDLRHVHGCSRQSPSAEHHLTVFTSATTGRYACSA